MLCSLAFLFFFNIHNQKTGHRSHKSKPFISTKYRNYDNSTPNTDLRDFCVAPMTAPSTIKSNKISENLTLKLVQVVLRHGARSPLSEFLPQGQRGNWICPSSLSYSEYFTVLPLFDHSRRVHSVIDPRLSEYPPSCKLGDLLLEGFDELHQLGQKYREHYIEDLQFLPKDYFDSSLLYVHSTNSRRSFDSAVSFTQGLYNPENPNEVLTIETGGQQRDFYHVEANQCPELLEQDHQFRATDEYRNFVNATKYKLKPVYDFLNISFDTTLEPATNSTEFMILDNICDFLIPSFCNDKISFPNETLYQNLTDTCFQFASYMMANRYGHIHKGIAGSRSMRELNRLRNEFFSQNDKVDHGGKGNGKKFQIISSHDSTIVSLLLLFTGDQFDPFTLTTPYGPPYASHLTFETYENVYSHNLYLRLIYNGQEVKFFGRDDTLVSLDEVSEKVTPLIPHCPDFEVY